MGTYCSLANCVFNYFKVGVAQLILLLHYILCSCWCHVKICFGMEKAKLLTFIFKGQLQFLQGLSLCGQCASSIGGQPDAENHKWNWGHSQGINMCHLDRRINLSVSHAMCCALSCTPCINFLLSEFKVFVTQCQSHCRFLSRCSGTSPQLQEMLFSLNSTLGHLVDSGRGLLGLGQLTGVPTVATAW